MTDLPDLVKYMRERKGLSAAKLSNLAGKSPSYVAKLEGGDLEPSLGTFAAIAEVLEFTDAEIAIAVRMARKGSK